MKRLLKKVLCCGLVLILALCMSVAAFAAETPTEESSLTAAVHAIENTARAITNYSTGIIPGGGAEHVTVFTANPIFNENWTIGRVSGTSGKIDVEVRNGLGVLLGSKAFASDGDGTLTVFIPWDAGNCSIRVYNNNSYAGSWTISLSR